MIDFNFYSKSILESVSRKFQDGDDIIIVNPFGTDDDLYNRKWLLANIGNSGKIVKVISSSRALIEIRNRKTGRIVQFKCPLVFLRKESDIETSNSDPDRMTAINFNTLIDSYAGKFSIIKSRHSTYLQVSIKSKYDKNGPFLSFLYFYPLKEKVIVPIAAHSYITDKQNATITSISALKLILDKLYVQDLNKVAPAVASLDSVEDKQTAADLLNI